METQKLTYYSNNVARVVRLLINGHITDRYIEPTTEGFRIHYLGMPTYTMETMERAQKLLKLMVLVAIKNSTEKE